MSFRRIATLLLAFAMPATLTFIGCSDDDTPTDPNAGIQQVNIRMHAGDQFTYDRWDLDANNQKIATSKRGYDIEINKGVGLVGQYSDWFFRLGKDQQSQKRDTLFIRTETVTRQSNGSSYTEEVMAYGFGYKVLQSFIAEVMKLGNVGVPTIAAPQWNTIARYYDKSGNAIPVGSEWFIGPEDGVTMNFTINGFPIGVNAKIKGTYAAREEKIQAGNQQVTTWKSTITASFTLQGQTIVESKVHLWFSDDPDGQIRVLQESARATIPVVGITFDIPGETQELVSWF
ncbi:MAG: hypothetical protein M5R41_15040 [Bacteroidia bacterium]|nr:hypothetical protein [Bacteroidia bacterium]